MEAIGGVLSAFGLAASAGLNAYVPLLIVALVARFTDWIKLGASQEPLTRPWSARPPTRCCLRPGSPTSIQWLRWSPAGWSPAGFIGSRARPRFRLPLQTPCQD